MKCEWMCRGGVRQVSFCLCLAIMGAQGCRPFSKGDRAEPLRWPVMNMEWKWEIKLLLLPRQSLGHPDWFCIADTETRTLRVHVLGICQIIAFIFFLFSKFLICKMEKQSFGGHVPGTPNSSGKPHLPVAGKTGYLSHQECFKGSLHGEFFSSYRREDPKITWLNPRLPD